MKGLILCAGKGLGLRPLTLNRPKPAVMLANRPMLCYGIQKLLDANITEIGIVTGPESNHLKDVIETNFPGLHPVFITQQRPAGIADAVSAGEEFISGDSFVLLLGDNIFAEDLSVLIDKFGPATDAVIMVTFVDRPEKFGVVVFDGDKVVKLIEKPKIVVSNWAITGAYVFSPAIFEAIAGIVPSERGELEITDALQWLITNGKNVVPVKTNKYWLDTGTPENLLKANRYLLEKRTQGVIIGKDCVFTNSKLIPPVIIGDRCSFIDSIIGPYVSVGNDSKLANVVTNNSMLMEKAVLSNIRPVISNSIIGSNVSILNLDTGEDIKIIMGDYTDIN